MKGIKKGLAILLVLCTLLSMVVMTGAGVADDPAQDATAAQSTNDNFYKIVHLDCGRKYFTKNWIIALINEMAADGYNQLQLAFGNDGLRFLLDNMSFTVNGTTYGHNNVVSKVEQGNRDQNNSGDARWLSQTEMNEIIAAAKAKGIEIVPLLNLPGHANTILDIFGDQYNASGSQNTFDVTNEAGLNAAKEIFRKYVDYFASKGCKFFNFGADEYANDATNTNSNSAFSFSRLNYTDYGKFVDFINDMADYIIDEGMTPRAFNDGLYYNNQAVSINSAIQCCYWSSGWGGYDVASASTIANNGHAMINTHGDYYYVLGKDDKFDSGYDYANNWNNTTFMDNTVNNPVGSMFCIWCDFPNAEPDTQVAQKTRLVLRAMAAKMDGGDANSIDKNAVVPGGFNADGTINSTSGGDTAVTQNKTITVTVGGTATDIIQGGDYSNAINQDELDLNIATVSAAHTQVLGSKKTQAVTSIESGKQYLIVHKRGRLLTDEVESVSSGYYTYNRLKLSGEASADSTELWTITSSGSGYTIQNADGAYLTIGDKSASVSRNSATLSLTYKNEIWTIAQTVSGWLSSTTYYLNQYGGDQYNHAAGWSDSSAATDGGSQWEIYEIVETAPVDATTVTFTGVAEGTTYVTVGNTRYTINVVAEDLNNVAPLTVEYWITNARLTASDKANSVTINATDEGVYSEDGVNIADLAAPTASKDGRKQEYWQAKILDVTKNNSSTSGTELQTTKAGDDETLNGTAFTKVRYWNSVWQVYTTEWVSVDRTSTTVTYTGNNNATETYTGGKNQLVAYYMEVINIDNENGKSELHVNAADWGTKGDGSGDWGYTPEQDRCSVSVQIVYEDASTNPADTTADSLKTKTIVYGYWNGGRGLGTMIFNGQENYEIYKVTAETGDMTSSTSGNYVTVTNFNWDENEETVWKGDATQSVSIGNPAHNPSYEAPYDNLTWNTSSHNHNNAILIRVYVKAVATEDSLTVHYIDQTANTEFYDYNIAVASGTVFNEGFALNDGTLVNNTIINTNGVTQTVQSDLSTMPEIAVQYRGRDYTCVKVVRSAEGKDVYLYYTFNDVKSFVVDFGLPVNITMAKLGIDPSAWTSATVSDAKYGTATASIENGVTYTPTQTLKGAEVLTVTLANESESVTQQIYIYPATTVYYEEGFATPYDNSTSGDSKGTGTQTAEAVGGKQHVYGYDPAYASKVGASNNSQIMLDASGEGVSFEFTGTGVDIYTNSSPSTGTVMIWVYQKENGSETFKQLISVDTAMRGGTSNATKGQAVTAYNVPIVSLTGLERGTYVLYIDLVTSKVPQDDGTTVKDLRPVYVDGFRVHGTLDVVNTEAYQQDGEANPTFAELRNAVLAGLNVAEVQDSSQYAQQIADNAMSQVYASNETTNGAVVFTKNQDGVDNYDVQDLLDNGPKNEFYLFPGQTVVFKIEDGFENPQIGLKALNATVNYTMNGNESKALSTSTDMFYSVTLGNDRIVTIRNTDSSGILSITEIKAFAEASGASTQAMFAALSANDLMPALLSMGYEAEPVAATATLNITVQCGDKAIPVVLTAEGMSNETHTFTAAEIKAAVEQALPEGYTVEGVTFEDVAVAYGEASDVSFAAAEAPTPDVPVSVFQKIIQTAVKIVKKLFGWL